METFAVFLSPSYLCKTSFKKRTCLSCLCFSMVKRSNWKLIDTLLKSIEKLLSFTSMDGDHTPTKMPHCQKSWLLRTTKSLLSIREALANLKVCEQWLKIRITSMMTSGSLFLKQLSNTKLINKKLPCSYWDGRLVDYWSPTCQQTWLPRACFQVLPCSRHTTDAGQRNCITVASLYHSWMPSILITVSRWNSQTIIHRSGWKNGVNSFKTKLQ